MMRQRFGVHDVSESTEYSQYPFELEASVIAIPLESPESTSVIVVLIVEDTNTEANVDRVRISFINRCHRDWSCSNIQNRFIVYIGHFK